MLLVAVTGSATFEASQPVPEPVTARPDPGLWSGRKPNLPPLREISSHEIADEDGLSPAMSPDSPAAPKSSIHAAVLTLPGHK